MHDPGPEIVNMLIVHKRLSNYKSFDLGLHGSTAELAILDIHTSLLRQTKELFSHWDRLIETEVTYTA